jgi:hypothetical protein
MKLWREINPFVRGLLIVAVIAGIITAARAQAVLGALFLLIRIVFLVALVWLAYTLWRNHRVELSQWSARARIVFYGAAGLLVADMLVYFFRHVAGPDALAFFLVLGGCGYAMWRVWRDEHTYS